MHQIQIGQRVKVLVDDDRGCKWYGGVVLAHTTIGEAHRPGGWPTYDVETMDGRRYTHASPECVKVSR